MCTATQTVGGSRNLSDGSLVSSEHVLTVSAVCPRVAFCKMTIQRQASPRCLFCSEVAELLYENLGFSKAVKLVFGCAAGDVIVRLCHR